MANKTFAGYRLEDKNEGYFMQEDILELCDAYGVSGRESDVAKLIIEKIRPHCECKQDNLGNILAFKRGKRQPKKKIMLAAHMDEVGFLVSDILEDGTLKLAAVGGIDPNILVGKTLVVCTKEEQLAAVIGMKPVHLQKEAEKHRPVRLDALALDIGCRSYEEAKKHVRLGDMVCFERNFELFGEGLLKSKAQDDRLGCAILIKLLRSFDECDFYAVFSTLEEVGSQGAKVATAQIEPDVAIVVECTTAADFLTVDETTQVCNLAGGPVISFMDKGTIYDPQMIDLAFEVAAAENIKVQAKRGVFGGNDSRVIQTTGAGVRSLAVSLPTRYLHSAASVSSFFDIERTVLLLRAILNTFLDRGERIEKL